MLIVLDVEEQLKFIPMIHCPFPWFRDHILPELMKVDDVKNTCNVIEGVPGPRGLSNCPCYLANKTSPMVSPNNTIDGLENIIILPKKTKTPDEWYEINKEFKWMLSELSKIVEADKDDWKRDVRKLVASLKLCVGLSDYLHTINGPEGEPGKQSGVCKCPGPIYGFMSFNSELYYKGYVKHVREWVRDEDVKILMNLKGVPGPMGMDCRCTINHHSNVK